MSLDASERNRLRGKRVVIGAGVFAVVAFLVAVGSQFSRGAAVDACAEKLLAAARAKDAAWLSDAVRTPSVRDRLVARGAEELAFARPVSSEWSRVGLVVTSTTGRSVLVLLLESSSLPTCRFLADYERGAFGR